MTDPIIFTDTTPRHELPFLFTGQSQKEFFVNEALAKIDTLLAPVAQDELNTPPVSPETGHCWIIGASPNGDWAERAGHLAIREGAHWRFIKPADGLRVYNRTAKELIFYLAGWQRPGAPTLPTTGTTVDTELRATVADLIDRLSRVGILSDI